MAAIPPSPEPFTSATMLRAALRTGALSAVEAAEHYLARIESRPELGAFVEVTRASALAEAADADAQLAAHRADSAAPIADLTGIPIAHKDIVDVAGAHTTHGTLARQALVAATDHPVVHTLRRAGAVSLGKTQVPELGLNAYSENYVAPPARNPHELTRTPGGSSGGSAAAVAADLLPFAPGNDGGGSIRIPALACGLVGLKPGLGAVPGDVLQGVTDEYGAPRLTVSGPLAKTPRDAALLMDALAGPNARGKHQAAVLRAGELTGLAVGMSTASPFEASIDITLSADARRAHEWAAERLAEFGHRVGIARYRYDPAYMEVFTEGWISGLPGFGFTEEEQTRLTPLSREFLRRAASRSASEHRANATKLRGFARDVREQWGRTDIVLTPGLAFTPPKVGAFAVRAPADNYRLQCQWTPYTSMVNIAGLPAIAVPITTDREGMPVGVHLIGREGSEPQLLALAEQLMP